MSLTKTNKKHQELLHALLENFTTVAVRFADYNAPNGKYYTYKVPTSWNVKAGDNLVVDAPSTGMTVVKVVDAHAVPQLDAGADFFYKWAVQKVDRSGYDLQAAREKLFLEQMAVVERQHSRKELVEKVEGVLTGDAYTTFKAAQDALNGVTGQAPVATAPEAPTAS